jgi:CBS domain-containing protein
VEENEEEIEKLKQWLKKIEKSNKYQGKWRKPDMAIPYSVIEIYSSEEARHDGKPLTDAVMQHLLKLKLAARCIVTRGISGCYENGETATGNIEVLSYNMPIKIEVILPSAESAAVLPALEAMVCEGIVLCREVVIRSHNICKQLLPRHLKIKDIMTPSPRSVVFTTPLSDVATLLLSSIFSGIPVVDEESRPIGIITQGDLIHRAGMPMRIGMLAHSSQEKKDAVLKSLSSKRVAMIMSSPAISIEEDAMVSEAVGRMIRRKLKRLTVVDKNGQLVGMLSRLDIFRTAMNESPDWSAFQRQHIQVGNLQRISDVMRRDMHVVLPDTSVEDVIRMIDSNDIQRVAVVDSAGIFLGLISDQDLLIAFSNDHPGIWDFFVTHIPFMERAKQHRNITTHLQIRTAGEVMKTDLITVQENTPLDEALKLMVDKSLKRLPVLDASGKFMGLVSRDALLRTGFQEV